MTLFVVATPIGTLGDLSPRAKQVLGEVVAIAAEDTRTTRRLLQLVGVEAPKLIALHAHNEASRAQAVVELAMSADVALVSDAGTPGVSDPGGLLVQAALAAGVEVRSVPGPSALASALALSGFPGAPSSFLGFPPRKGRAAFARQVLRREHTVVIYEAPGRVASLTRALAELQPTREATLCREISKKFEEVLRAPLAELAAELDQREGIRGECVLVIGPGEALAEPSQTVEAGARLKEVATVLAEQWGLPKRDVYAGLVELRAALSDSDQ